MSTAKTISFQVLPLLLLSLLAISAVAPERAIAEEERDLTLGTIARSALQFVARDQVHVTGTVYVPGEWPSQVYSDPLPALAGVGALGGDEEPSAFTTASIINQLAMLYELRPDLKSIPLLIDRAIPTLDRYREGYLYNFYPARDWNGVRVHQPAAMTLSPLWKGFTNIPEDADTTSVTYAAKSFAARLHGKTAVLPAAVLKTMTRFRDLNRETEWYNEKLGQFNTGAFMTWQYDENDPRMPHNFFADPAEGKRIPFSRNDVDCIVNMNVLRMLAVHRASLASANPSITPSIAAAVARGRGKACAMLGSVVMNEQYAACGIYYPNTFNFAYSAALVDHAGEKCLAPYASRVVGFTLKNQNMDGGWFNIDNLEKDDRVQATAFALYALAQFGNVKDPQIRLALQKGEAFLVRRMQRSGRGDIYWPGETFFTATAVARSIVDWKADSFTTLTALTAIVKAERALGRQ